MPPADSSAQAPRFRLWIRRTQSGDAAYTLRFEVMDGKGILRVARPGVLIDPPARPTGLEERLSAQQLRTTRFILVWDAGRARHGHLLSRLEEPGLSALEFDRWHELEVVVEGGFRYVVLPVVVPVATPARPAKGNRPSLSELRQELDSLTLRGEEDEDPDSALASLTGPSGTRGPLRAVPEAVEVPEPKVALRAHKGAAASGPGPGLESVNMTEGGGLSPPPTIRAPDTHEVAFAGTGDARRARQAPSAAVEAFVNSQTIVNEPEAGATGSPNARAGDTRAGGTAAGKGASDAEDESLALGEADPGIEGESLELGEADPDAEGEALSLGEIGPGTEGEALALGEADGDGESLALGEADGEGESLSLGGDEGGAGADGERERLPTEPMDAPSPCPGAQTPADSPGPLTAGFADDDEEAAFSVDLPSFRRATDHVTVSRPVEDAVTRLDGPLMGTARKPISSEELPAPRKVGREGGIATVARPAPADDDARLVLPAQPPSGGVRRGGGLHDAPTTNTEDQSGPEDNPVMHRSGHTLVRHLRRRVEEQRNRISELEARIVELEGLLLAVRGLRD